MSKPVTRSSKTNLLMVLGIIAFFVVVWSYAWVRWDTVAKAGGDASSDGSWLWGLVIVGGPALLLVAIIVNKLRTRGVSRAIDPTTPSDDPSKGISGHD
jgi:uncharacterized membrane protein